MESKMDGKEENESRKGGNGKRGRGWEETDSQALTKTQRERETGRQRDRETYRVSCFSFVFIFFFIVVCLPACQSICLSVCLPIWLCLFLLSVAYSFLSLNVTLFLSSTRSLHFTFPVYFFYQRMNTSVVLRLICCRLRFSISRATLAIIGIGKHHAVKMSFYTSADSSSILPIRP